MRKASILAATAVTFVAAAVAWLPAASASAIPTTASPGQPAGAIRPVAKHPDRRLCAVAKPGFRACNALARTDVAGHKGLFTANATPSGYGPADLQSAYKLPSSSAGGGQTVAIVDAQDDPNAESDLASYRSQYGLSSCTTANGCFRKVNQSGGTSYPAPDSGWAGEISLDLDMVSAACPNCHILLVEATSPTTANLGTAVNEAVRLGAKYVSNSYGGSESSGESSTDNAYYNHPGVAITVSSGDSGYGVEYPAASQYVTAVGGTSLTRSSNSRGWGESAWSGAGSGCSSYEAKPSFQTDSGCGRRTVADVSSVADPNTGVAVYDSYQSQGWNVYGGTSAAAPVIASVYALAGTPGANDQPNSYPYAHTSSLFDVTSGSNGSCGGSYLCTAKAGYDGPTGLGTPNGVAAFASGGSNPPPPPPPGCTGAGQKLGNPGFETGSAAPWSASSGVISANGSGASAHSGSYFAWLDGYGRTHTDTLSQSVAIPSGCSSYTLSFYVNISTQESGSTAYDKLTVKAGSSTLATYSNANATNSYVQKSINVAAYAGKTVTLSFTGHEDSSLATSFLIDDTALTVS